MIMKIKILVVIIGSALFIIGGVTGFVLGKDVQEKISRTALEIKAGEIEKSQVAQSLCANLKGEVIEIIENALILKEEEDSLKMEISPETRIFGGALGTEEIKFEEIKAGDFVYVYARLTQDGGLMANSITILPYSRD